LIAVSGYIWFYLARKISKGASAGKKLWAQMVVLAWIQAGLGKIVLVFTGWKGIRREQLFLGDGFGIGGLPEPGKACRLPSFGV